MARQEKIISLSDPKRRQEVTPRERAEAIPLTYFTHHDTWIDAIERAIIAATVEKDARIKELEEENARLRHILKRLGEGGGTVIN
jgi:hypothetical protein